MITIVKTYDGSEANKKECRFIKGDFYIKNKQCFQINGTWYRINSGFIVFDHEAKQWVVVKENPSLIKGVVGIDTTTSEAIMGFYTANPYRNIMILLPGTNTPYNCIGRDVLTGDFVEDTVKMIFIHKKNSTTPVVKPNTVQYSNNGYPFPLPYGVKSYNTDILARFKGETKEKLDLKQKTLNIVNHASALGDYTFGFEFETNRGKIPNYLIAETGLLPLRDGSISGIEFATIPLQGKGGLIVLENACKALQRYTTISEQESLHLHIGNIPVNEKFVAYLFTICCILEKEIYSLFPAWYAQTSKFKSRGKDYNMPLRKDLVGMTPKETFANLSYYLSDGKKYQGLGSAHPSDPAGEQKWNVHSRYHWVNAIPLLFGDNKTIEFRVHVPTRDPIKVINWLYICSAIVKYAEYLTKRDIDLNEERSLKLTSVLNQVYDFKLASYLNGYINERKKNRINDERNGDCTGAMEINSELRGLDYYQDII